MLPTVRRELQIITERKNGIGMDLQFCQQCGERLLLIEIGDEGVVPHSTACTRSYLAHPACSVLVSAINENTLNIVLLRQDNVSDSHWVLVAGYTSNRVSVRSIQLRGKCWRKLAFR